MPRARDDDERWMALTETTTRTTTTARASDDRALEGDDSDARDGRGVEGRLAALEAAAVAVETNLVADEAAVERRARARDGREAREDGLREALRAKERAIESLGVSLMSTRESYERRLRVETEASAATARREESLRDDVRALSERVRSLETKAETREQKISSQEDVIQRMSRELEAKRSFDVEVAEHARTIEMDRLAERLRASDERAAALEAKLQLTCVEKSSLEREIEILRERLANTPTQAAMDDAYRFRVELDAEAKIANERLAFEEKQTKAELAQLFTQIKEMTLRSAGATAPVVRDSRESVDAELRRAKQDAEAEIESRRAEFRKLQSEILRDNARLHRELAALRGELDDKLRESSPGRAAPPSSAERSDVASPWAADFTFPLARDSPSGSVDSFIEISPH